MTDVFLDTVGLLAVWDRADQWHQQASPVYEEILKQRTPLFTTTAILLECGNAAARRPYRLAVDRLRLRLERAETLIAITDADWRTAWTAYEGGEADNAGVVDQLSFAVMRRLGITRVFSNDQHFRAAGFETLF